MSILHRNGTPFFPTFDGFLVPSCCKDYFLEKVLCMVPEKSQFSDSVTLRTWYII